MPNALVNKGHPQALIILSPLRGPGFGENLRPMWVCLVVHWLVLLGKVGRPASFRAVSTPLLTYRRPFAFRHSGKPNGQDEGLVERSLRDPSSSGQAETSVVVAVVRRVPVPVGGTAVPAVVVPGATAQHAVITSCTLTLNLQRRMPLQVILAAGNRQSFRSLLTAPRGYSGRYRISCGHSSGRSNPG